MAKTNQKAIKRQTRHRRIRAKVKGTIERPRLSVFKSNKYIYAQIIDDQNGKTLVAQSGMGLKAKNKSDEATLVGKGIAELAKAKKITQVVFDRGGYIYTGRVKALAEAAREGGLEF